MTSEVGFNALFFGRIDYQDREKRLSNKGCEGIWESSPNLADSEVFWGLTGSYNGNYGEPPGFCFDAFCGANPLVGLSDAQLKSRIEDFFQVMKVQADRTRGSHIMVTMGSDFQVSLI